MARDDDEVVALLTDCLRLPISDDVAATLSDARAVAWVASGLTACAAECGRFVLQQAYGLPSVRFSAFEYCTGRTEAYRPVLVSYKGRNHDIQSVAAKAIANRSPGVLISGFPGTRAEKLLAGSPTPFHVLSLPDHPVDRDFVAERATLAMSALALRLGFPPSSPRLDEGWIVERVASSRVQAAEVFENLMAVPRWQHHRLILLGGGSASAGLVAWQAALAEGGLTSAIVSDLKDHTHGRYFAAFREETLYVVLSDADSAPLAQVAGSHLRNAFPTVQVQSAERGVGAVLDHLLVAFEVVRRLAAAQNVNLASPRKPAIAATWRNWGKISIRHGVL